MPKKLTREEFIRRANEVHKGKYDYSKVVYVNNRTKVCIISPDYGEFWITPNHHLSGVGKTRIHAHTRESFISEANKVHRGLYDYSLIGDSFKGKIPLSVRLMVFSIKRGVITYRGMVVLFVAMIVTKVLYAVSA